jgi:3-hydroxyisobutyrate dehydrogenase-like beta-hydroxyacid dehydrogenase
LKVIGISFIFNMVEAIAEGHVLAEKTGLGSSKLHEYLTVLFPGVYTAYSNRMISGDYWDRNEVSFFQSNPGSHSDSGSIICSSRSSLPALQGKTPSMR